LRELEALSHPVVPHPQGLELPNQIAIHLQELPRERLALEQVRDLGLDALVTPGDRRDGGGRGDGDEEGVAETVPLDPGPQPFPVELSAGRDAPGVELELAAGGAGLLEGRMTTALDGELHGRAQGVEVDV